MVEHGYQVMTRAIDPTPVPSFRGVGEDDRAAHLEKARSEVDALACSARLQRVIDALLEASVPPAYKAASTSLAVDWTDHETWSRPRAKADQAPANDADASWGHAKRNAPGAKDGLFSATTPRWPPWSQMRAVPWSPSSSVASPWRRPGWTRQGPWPQHLAV